jgi:isopentenyl-diphosphate delta-isomerase
MTRDAQLVELVDASGVHCGQSTVDEAHRAPGLRHRAFSVLLLDGSGRLLLQRRSARKTRFPLRWANACCGHPAPGQPVLAAATRRLYEELSVTGVALDELGVHSYVATDPATGRVEREWDHVLLGRVDSDIPLDPDPAEVDSVRWISLSDLRSSLPAEPDLYAPWLGGVVALLPVS